MDTSQDYRSISYFYYNYPHQYMSLTNIINYVARD